VIGVFWHGPEGNSDVSPQIRGMRAYHENRRRRLLLDGDTREGTFTRLLVEIIGRIQNEQIYKGIRQPFVERSETVAQKCTAQDLCFIQLMGMSLARNAGASVSWISSVLLRGARLFPSFLRS
jgi:hypothetical protein